MSEEHDVLSAAWINEMLIKQLEEYPEKVNSEFYNFMQNVAAENQITCIFAELVKHDDLLSVHAFVRLPWAGTKELKRSWTESEVRGSSEPFTELVRQSVQASLRV